MGVVSTPVAPLRTLRVAAAYLVRGVARGGCERVEERGARACARVVKSVYISSLVFLLVFTNLSLKETQNGTRAARTRARITSTLTRKSKMRPAAPRSSFFDQKRDGSESGHSSWARRGTANLGTARHRKYWHGNILARHDTNIFRMLGISFFDVLLEQNMTVVVSVDFQIFTSLHLATLETN